MKIAATLTLLFSLPAIHIAPVVRVPAPAVQPAPSFSTLHGQWYLADTGHAVYCYGPVLTMGDLQNGIHRVATFCRGDHPMVPLKD